MNILLGQGTDLEQLNHSQEYIRTQFYFQPVQPMYNTRVMNRQRAHFAGVPICQNETIDALNLSPKHIGFHSDMVGAEIQPVNDFILAHIGKPEK